MTTTGPNSPGTAADDSGTGSITWLNPNNAEVSDNSRANATGLSFGTTASHYLKVTNFGFAIASDQQIDGIQVDIERVANLNTGFDYVKDNIIKLAIAGTISGSSLADTGTKWPGFPSEAYASYGGATSLWGLTPTYSDINDTGFGVFISANVTYSGGKTNSSANIDHVRITIYHSTAAAAGQPTSKRFGGVPFMGAHGAGIPSAVRQWMRRDSGLFAPQVATAIWRPAHGIN